VNISALALLISCSIASSGPAAGDQAVHKDADLLRESANRFALKLYPRLRSTDRPNLFFSPLSIYTALGMTQAGARGATADQLASVMEVPRAWNQESLHTAYGAFLKNLVRTETKAHLQLNIADRLCVASEVGLREQFVELLKTRYDATVGVVDFKGQPEHARLEINKWVSDKTEHHIPELFAPGSISDQTVLVLANAIFFKGRWAKPFDPKHTRPGSFRVSAAETVQVPMMIHQGRYQHAELKELELVELEYAGKSASMVIMLPCEGFEVKQIEQLLPEHLDNWLKSLGAEKPKTLAVQLPRFQIQWRSPLVEPLKAMGLDAPFSDKADFSGISSPSHLSLSNILHEAVVEVNEEGTVASAATAGVIVRGGGEFTANHPFLFLIRDLHTGVILFLGRVSNPLKN
jgi:serine protease inhibitor